jgi:hypothetical protein
VTAVGLAPLGAAGVGRLRAEGPRRFTGPSRRIELAEPVYVVASAATLEVAPGFVVDDGTVAGARLDEAKDRLRTGEGGPDYRVVAAHEVEVER